MVTACSANLPIGNRNYPMEALRRDGWRSFEGEPLDLTSGLDHAGVRFTWPGQGPNALRPAPSQKTSAAIPIGRSASMLWFLHTFEPGDRTIAYQTAAVDAKARGDKPDDLPVVFTYELTYSDGEKLSIPVRWDESIHDIDRDSFWDRRYGMLADLDWADVAAVLPDASRPGRSTVLYAMRWPNPRPEKPIQSVRMAVSAQGWGTATLLDVVTQQARVTGQVRYVHPAGDDEAEGSFDRPWKTPTKAIQALKPGDTLYFRGGRYKPTQRIEAKLPGTAEAPITISAYPGETPIIDASEFTYSNDPGIDPAANPFRGRVGFLDLSGSSHLTVRGLHLENTIGIALNVSNVQHTAAVHNTIYMSFASGIFMTGHHSRACNNLVIRACSLTAFKQHYEHSDARKRDPFVVAQKDYLDSRNRRGGFGDEAIDVGGSGSSHLEGGYNESCWSDKEGWDTKGGPEHVRIHHNYIHHNWFWVGLYVDGWTQPMRHIQIDHNVSCDNWGIGIAVNVEHGPLVEDVRIHHNLSFDNGLSGIDIGRAGKDHPRKNLRIENNTLVGNGFAEWNKGPAGGINLGSPNVEDVVIQNNICFGNRDYGISTFGPDHTGKNITIRHNLIHPAVQPAWLDERKRFYATPGDGVIEADPGFVDLKAENFRLRPGSPALGAGRGDVSWHSGKRNQVDMGAFAEDDP